MSEGGKLGKVPTERLHLTRGGQVIERGSGIREDGSWEPAFAGQRPPWAKGNDLQRVHGALSSVERLLPEAEPLADELTPLVPSYSPSDRPAVLLLALALRRIERAEAHLTAVEEADGVLPERLDKLQGNVRAWTGTAAKLLDALGMTPTARARLGLDLARGASVLDEYVSREYPVAVEAALPPKVEPEAEA